MTRPTALLLALGLTLAACFDKDDADDSGGDATDSGSTGDGADGAGDGADGAGDGADAGDGGDGTADAAPSVSSGSVVCIPATSGPEAIVLQVQGADPQGEDTMDGGTWRATSGGAVLFDDVALVCSPSAACSASIHSEDYGTSCADGGSTTWEVELMDEDGNSSGWVTVSWEG